MLDDQDLTRLLAQMRESYRVAKEPPLEAMWRRIEAQTFAPGATPRLGRPAPLRRWFPLAATLVLGFGLGQLVPRLGPARGPSEELAGGSPSDGVPGRLVSREGAPFVGIASHYLEQVTALLVTLAGDTPSGRLPDYTVVQARDLLATTRLLMDSPQRIDPAIRDLLDDLELVLAQIVRLPDQPGAREVYFIDQALDQRDVIPRLRFLLADNRRPE